MTLKWGEANFTWSTITKSQEEGEEAWDEHIKSLEKCSKYESNQTLNNPSACEKKPKRLYKDIGIWTKALKRKSVPFIYKMWVLVAVVRVLAMFASVQFSPFNEKLLWDDFQP